MNSKTKKKKSRGRWTGDSGISKPVLNKNASHLKKKIGPREINKETGKYFTCHTEPFPFH